MKDQQQHGKVGTNLQRNLASAIPDVMAVAKVVRERGGWPWATHAQAREKALPSNSCLSPPILSHPIK
jgi:hypothetical protein